MIFLPYKINSDASPGNLGHQLCCGHLVLFFIFFASSAGCNVLRTWRSICGVCVSTSANIYVFVHTKKSRTNLGLFSFCFILSSPIGYFGLEISDEVILNSFAVLSNWYKSSQNWTWFYFLEKRLPDLQLTMWLLLFTSMLALLGWLEFGRYRKSKATLRDPL